MTLLTHVLLCKFFRPSIQLYSQIGGDVVLLIMWELHGLAIQFVTPFCPGALEFLGERNRRPTHHQLALHRPVVSSLRFPEGLEVKSIACLMENLYRIKSLGFSFIGTTMLRTTSTTAVFSCQAEEKNCRAVIVFAVPHLFVSIRLG